MNIRIHLVVIILILSIIFPFTSIKGIQESNEKHSGKDIDYQKTIFDSSNHFNTNMGQIKEGNIRFYSNGGDIFFASDSIYFRIRELEPIQDEEPGELEYLHDKIRDHSTNYIERGVVLRYTFMGSNAVIPVGRERCSWNNNYFLGNDPEGWHTDVPNFYEVVYPDLWDGIDLVYRLKDGCPKYDLIVSPGADPSDIGFRIEGHESLSIDNEGNLVIGTGLGDILDTGLYAYQKNEIQIECDFQIIDPSTYGFRVYGYEKTKKLIIDPFLDFSIFIGGTTGESGWGIDTDSKDNIYITGNTGSSDFPTTAGAYDTTYSGNPDAFITKISPDGSSILFSTYIGGRGMDQSRDISIDLTGNVFISGDTNSTDYPTTKGAYETIYSGGRRDYFVTKLNSSGSSLDYSTFIASVGGGGFIRICVGVDGCAYITGNAFSSYPTTNGAYDTGHNGIEDVFVTKINSAGSSLIYSTYIGGNNIDQGDGICVDDKGSAYVTGYTCSSNYPTTVGAYDTSMNGQSSDVFVSKLNPSGSSLMYSTFLGGSIDQGGKDIIVDSTGRVLITGYTSYSSTTNFPTTVGSYDTSHNGGLDAFVTMIGSTGSSLVYSTFLGGSGNDLGEVVTIDILGNAIVSGYITSQDFPITPDAYDSSFNGGYSDLFVTRFNADGSSISDSTYLGGNGWDVCYGISINSIGNILLTGRTDSSDFPVTKGGGFSGSSGCFVIKCLSALGSEPDIVYSLNTCSDPSYSIITDKFDIEDKVYLEIRGQDSNDSFIDHAKVIINSSSALKTPIIIPLIETDINSGVYRGEYRVTAVFTYLESITFSSWKDPTIQAVIQVHTPLQIRPILDHVDWSEDTFLEFPFWNFGYNHVDQWTLSSNAEWLTWDGRDQVINGTPDNSDVGQYWVNISAEDDKTNMDFINFTIDVLNTPPTIETENVVYIYQYDYYYIDYASDDEGQGDTLWTCDFGNAYWLSFDGETGILNGTPLQKHVGSYRINITINDGNHGWNWTEFDLEVIDVNDPPTITSEPLKSIHQGDVYYIDFEATDIDDVNIFKWTMNTDSRFLYIDKETGVVSGTPSNDDVGEYFINVTAEDLRALSDWINFTIEVNDINDDPVWLNIPIDPEVNRGQIFSFIIDALDVDKNDQIEYTIESIPDVGMEINSETGEIYWNSSLDGIIFSDGYIIQVTIRASDGEVVISHWFSLKVKPNPSPISNLISPEDDDMIPSYGVLLEWEGMDDSSEIEYDIYISDSYFEIVDLIDNTLKGQDLQLTSYWFDDIVPGKTYYWTVIPKDQYSSGICENGPFSFRINTFPQIEEITEQSVNLGEEFSLILSGSDLETSSEDLEYSLISGPEGMEIFENRIFWTPGEGDIGTHTVEISLYDGLEYSNTSFEVTVSSKDTESDPGESETNIGIILGVSAGIILIIIAVSAAIIFIIRSKKKEEEGDPIKGNIENDDLDPLDQIQNGEG